MKFLTLSDMALSGQRVLIRQDLNVPVSEGNVSSDARIRAALPTIIQARDAGAKVMLMSHLGRPTEGKPEADLSLAPVAEHLSLLLGTPVRLITDYLTQTPVVADGEVVLFENVRFNPGEKANDETLAQQYAALCDFYVMDAFGTAHRAQASTHGVGIYASQACAGPLLSAELEALGKALDQPKRPLVALVGGSKVSTKLTVLESLSQVVDQLIVGGGIANTFIAAAGNDVGQSLCEEDLISTCQSLSQAAQVRGGNIPVPIDVVCAKAFSADAKAEIKPVAKVEADDMILDIGPDSAAELAEMIKNAGTILWNGPVGVFEFSQFAKGTEVVAQAIAESSAFSVAGGGDTLAAVDQFGIADQLSYISTGGGAFLEFLEGKVLPAVAMLESRAK